MELVCNVESIDGVSLIADVLVSVQDALRDLARSQDLPPPDPTAADCVGCHRCPPAMVCADWPKLTAAARRVICRLSGICLSLLTISSGGSDAHNAP
jgi:hypothetical protein